MHHEIFLGQQVSPLNVSPASARGLLTIGPGPKCGRLDDVEVGVATELG
ncbi:MAG: hypothetical protein H0X18_02420 [Geodermatophilaceae bacterium]|nr:hypothetical protein [Geodermatophilaceae bacterium]